MNSPNTSKCSAECSNVRYKPDFQSSMDRSLGRSIPALSEETPLPASRKKNKKKNKKNRDVSGDNLKKLSKKLYEKEIAKLHVELVKLQEWVKAKGLKVVVIFEGRDAAGKGGVIKRI